MYMYLPSLCLHCVVITITHYGTKTTAVALYVGWEFTYIMLFYLGFCKYTRWRLGCETCKQNYIIISNGVVAIFSINGRLLNYLPLLFVFKSRNRCQFMQIIFRETMKIKHSHNKRALREF